MRRILPIALGVFLVILFAGALEHLFRPSIARAFTLMSTPARRRMVDVEEKG